MRRFWPRISIAIAILALVHIYIWSQLVAPLASPMRPIATAAMAVLAPSFPATIFFSRRLSRAAARPLLLVGYIWFGYATYLLLGAVGAQVAVLFGAAPHLAAAIGAGAAFATASYGLVHVARGPKVRRTDVPIARLPVESYTIVQLTDVHIGTLIGRELAGRVVEQVNALAPDLIVITGDFVDGRLEELRPHVEPFRGLRARDGVFAVTGNHEYYWNANAWLEHIRSLGIRVLRNENVTVGDTLVLAGADDSSAGEDVPRAVAGRDPKLPLVLLAHHPRTIALAMPAGVDLQLSGHTHGGQLLPLGWLSKLFDPHISGLARFGATWLYVSEGTGFWGPPMRVGTTQEIALLTLRRS